MIVMQMDMVATYNETTLASNDPRKDLPAGFYTMKSLVSLKKDLFQNQCKVLIMALVLVVMKERLEKHWKALCLQILK